MSSEKTEPVSQQQQQQAAAAPAAPDISLQLETFVEVYKKQIGIVILAGAILGTVGYAYTANQKKKENAASTALAMVELNLPQPAPGGKAAEPKPEDFFKVAADFAGTAAAERAILHGAVALFEADKFAEAQQKFEEFSAQYPASEAKATAELGVAASLEAQKQLDKAAEAYQRVITSYATQSEATQAKLGLASVHEQKGQAAQALKLYEEVGTVRPGTQPGGWSNEANSRKERLLAAHPELAVTAPAPAPVSTPAVPKN
ncbi:MAG TPA: tetratricopeptide repeat protein [Verrucomicrobiae bacterium]